MKLTSATIEGFVGSCLSKSFHNPVKSPSVHREWWDLCCSDDRYVALAAPRGHAKSTAISFAYVLAAVLFQEHSFVVIISDTESQSTLFLNDIKKELIENEDIIQLFGVEKLEKDQETDIVVRMSDGHRFRIMAKGSEQKLRGLKWRGMRPDLIIGDDLENDEIVMNPDRRAKFSRWMNAAVLPCLSYNGKIRIVGTILHMDSYLENRMPRLHAKTTIIEPLRVYSTSKVVGWRSIKYRAHSDEFEKILWPEMFSEKWFREKRASLVAQGQADIYNQEYLNNPIDESRAYFRREDMLPITDAVLQDILQEKIPLNYFIGADLAVTTKQKSDFTVFVVVGIDSSNMMYVFEVIRGRYDTREIIDLFFELEQKYKPQWFAVEKGTIDNAIGPFLQEEMYKRDMFPFIEKFAASVDKVERARSIIGRVRVNGVRFLKDSEWYPAFEAELTQFDRAPRDDQVDAFAMIGLGLMKLAMAPTAEEEQEEEYEEEKERSQIRQDTEGRSMWTGY